MAVVLALFSSLLWGTSDFLGGTAARRLPALAVVGWSQVVGLFAALAVCLATGAFGVEALRTAGPGAAAAGLAGVSGLVAFYAALSVGTMGVVAPIAATGVVVPVAAGVIDGERPGAVALTGLVVAIVGIVLASGPELRGGAGWRPLALAAFAALAFGLSLTFLAEGAQTSTALSLLMMRAAPVTVVLLIALAVRSTGGVGRGDLPLLLVIGIGDVGANLMFGLASTRGLLSLVAVAGSLYPVVTVLLARVFHRERLGSAQYAGVVLALGGVGLIAAGGT